MNVLIVNNMAPFVWGGAEELAKNLCLYITKSGHNAEICRLPFQWEPYERIVSQMLMANSIKLSNVDKVIALKFPSYLIPHDNKTLWVLHQYRQAYDLFDAGMSNIPDSQKGKDLIHLIKSADDAAFRDAHAIFTNSKVTQDRLKKYNNITSEVLLPPVNDEFLFQCKPSNGYIFAGGRINSMKRQHFLLEAFAKSKTSLKMVVAGPPDSIDDALAIQKCVEQYDLRDRVKLDLGFLDRRVYANYINDSTAVAYMPYDEDSLGYVAMEAALASKPIISLSDSGGILGLAKHQQTGWVSEPDIDSLAETLSTVLPEDAVHYGQNARALWLSMGINWDNTIEKLLK